MGTMPPLPRTPPTLSSFSKLVVIHAQTRVEENIREMEGVMEIEFLHAVAASQSPSAPETPGALMSQGSASGDSEWSLPTVMSVTPPTVTDCQDLLARAQAFF